MPIFSPDALRAAVQQRLAEPDAQASLVRQALLSQLDPAETPAPAARKGIGLAPYLALAGGSLADGISTVQALKRPGTYEANPFLSAGGTAGMVAVKAASTAAVVWAMRRLAAQGHPTAAKIIGYGGGAGYGALAAHNMGQGK